jgi:GDPmannose 4,6-dehydratase
VPRRALITGITGQDGSYLTDLLCSEGAEVFGVARDPRRAADLVDRRVTLVPGDLLDTRSLTAVVQDIVPDELYHLAAPTFVPSSWDDPTDTMEAIVTGTAALLAAAVGLPAPPRVWVASSSEVFGDSGEHPQREASPMHPRTPYGVAKLAAHRLTGVMRDHHGLFTCSGLTFNHESPRRPERFLPRKVTRAAAAIALGHQRELLLGSLDAVRDWSHAEDVMRAAMLAVRHAEPGDYVVASGQARTVRDLVAAAFGHVGLDPDAHVRVDAALVRPPETTPPVGDPTRARTVLGWTPRWSFEQMIAEMVDADLAALGGAAR